MASASTTTTTAAAAVIAGPANASTSSGEPLQDEATSLLRELSFWDVGDATTTTQPQQSQQSPPMDRNNNTTKQRHQSLSSSSTTATTNTTTTTTSSSTTTTMIVNGEEEERAAAKWKTATDPATGKIYYYDVLTRKTQWEKPREIKALEQKRRQVKRDRDVAFFRIMEANIRASLARGECVPGVSLLLPPSSAAVPTAAAANGDVTTAMMRTAKTGGPSTSRKNQSHTTSSAPPPTLLAAGQKPGAVRVRTISGMNEHWLAELAPPSSQPRPLRAVVATVPTTTNVLPTTPATTSSSAAATATSHQQSLAKPPLLPPRHQQQQQLPPQASTTTSSRDDDATPNYNDEEEEEEHYHSSPSSTPGNERTSMSSSDDGDATDDDLLRGVDFVGLGSNSGVERHMRRNTYDGGPPRRAAAGGPTASSATHQTVTSSSTSTSTTTTTTTTSMTASTMDRPDIPATIKTVCGVIRAHILQSCRSNNRPRVLPTVNVAIFNDRPNTTTTTSPASPLPSVQQVQDFYWGFYRRSQMEFDAIILSLIYVERLIKCTEGVLMPSPDNWQSILFSCMVLASKVWDDLSMWNVDFSNVSGNVHFGLQRINELERAVLKCLNYAVVISASEYAKYYYLLRNLMIRSSAAGGGLLLGDENGNGGTGADPCADRLQDRTRHYQATQLLERQPQQPPGGGGTSSSTLPRRAHSVDWSGPVLKEALCMEQLVAGH